MKAALPFLAIALAACATVPGNAYGPTAGLGQTAHVGEIRVKPLAVIEDSRCPIDVRCVWAGRLVIEAQVQFHGGSEEFRGSITLGQPLALGDETITLVSAAPVKMTGRPIEPRSYRFTFAIERRP